MTRDEIIKWAKDCLLLDFRDNPATDTAVAQFVGTLEDFAGLVAAAEREACAKTVEAESCGGSAFNSAAQYMAKAIRARSEKGQS